MSVTLQVRPEAAEKIAYCVREDCRAPMLYRYLQVPGDGTVARSTRELCSTCYRRSMNVVPFTPGKPPFRRRGQALLEDIPFLLDQGLDAETVAKRVGHANAKCTYRFLLRHGERDLVLRLLAAKPEKHDSL